jgi:hypothetical protein
VTAPGVGARITPFEIGLPDPEFRESIFTAIREEAHQSGYDLSDPGAFVLVAEVGRAVREIQGDERGGGALQRYGAFLFQAYHFHVAGDVLYVLDEDAARHLVRRDFEGSSWDGELPSEAGYLQLPQHLFWSEPSEGEPAEPIDGVSWAQSAGDTLSLLVSMGIRRGRPGLSLSELPPTKLAGARMWPTTSVRLEGVDFEGMLPGSELGELYSVVTMGEALKLLARAFAYIAESPDAVSLATNEGAPEEERLGIGSSSRLSFRRIQAPLPNTRGPGR